MKSSILAKLVISVVAMLMLSHFLQPSMIYSAAQKQQVRPVQEFAEQWKQELAKIKQFEQWTDASLNISPLGPGTHSWFAVIERNHMNIGYMIIHATEDGQYVLGEYGVLDDAMLEHISKHIDTLFYQSPAQAVIVEKSNQEIVYYDLFSLEQLPLQATHIQSNNEMIRHGNDSLHASILEQHLNLYFSPYYKMPWLTSKPINDKLEDCTSIKALLDGELEIRFVASAWDDLIQQTYSVTGYHNWGEFKLYLALQQENEDTIRYIPYETLMEIGLFYK